MFKKRKYYMLSGKYEVDITEPQHLHLAINMLTFIDL